MMQQLNKLPDIDSVKRARSEVESKLSSNLVEKMERIEQLLSAKSVNSFTKQKGASNWLSTLPLDEQGFTLTKSEFRDSLALRYAKDIRELPSKCTCGHIQHQSSNELQTSRFCHDASQHYPCL